MYSTTGITTTSNDVAYLEAGIHDNVELVNIRKDVSPNGNKFIELTFDKDGERMIHTEYEPKRSANETQEEFDKKQANQGARFYRIGSCFTQDPDLFKYTAIDFDDFMNKFMQRVNPIYKGVKLRVKVVLNNKNFTTLPKYTTYTFIEPMSVEKSKIKKLTIDKFDKTFADSEKTVANPFDTTNVTTTAKTDDLPF